MTLADPSNKSYTSPALSDGALWEGSGRRVLGSDSVPVTVTALY